MTMVIYPYISRNEGHRHNRHISRQGEDFTNHNYHHVFGILGDFTMNWLTQPLDGDAEVVSSSAHRSLT